MRILCDVDWVVCDFASEFLKLVKIAGGGTFTPEDVTDYRFEKCLNTSEEHIKAAYRLLEKPRTVLNMQSIEGSYKGVAALMNAGHDVVFVTAPPESGHPTWTSEREQWIQDRWPGAHVVHTRHKFYVSGDAMIDDTIEHLIAWKNEHPKGLAFLWDAPHNRNYFGPGFLRVHNWGEVLKLL